MAAAAAVAAAGAAGSEASLAYAPRKKYRCVKRQSCKPTNKQASKKCLVAYPLPLTLWSVTAARRPSDGGGGGNSPGCSSLVRMVILPCTMLVETVWAAALAAAASCRARCSRTFLPPRFVFFFLTAPPSP